MKRMRFPVWSRRVLLVGIAVLGIMRLRAQSNCVAYTAGSTGSGKFTLFVNYNPFTPASKAPVNATAVSTTSPGVQPTVSASQYSAYKSTLISSTKTNFSFPPSIQISPPTVAAKAPAAVAPVAPAPTVSWQAIQDSQNGGSTPPPSPDIAVGPTDVIVAVNSSIAFYTRTGTLEKLTAFTDWFGGLLPTICPSNCQIYDPILRYDQIHGRFLFLASARTVPDLRVGYTLLSVSNGPSVSSGWRIWVLNPVTENTNATWGDFWRISFDNASIYLGGNLFSPASISGTFQYAKIRVLKKSEVYNPSSTSISYSDIWNLQNADGNPASSLDPVQQRGLPSAVNTGLFVNASDVQPATFLTVWKLTNPQATPLAVTRCNVTGVMTYYYPTGAPQLGGPRIIDTGDSRVLKAAYRDGSLYVAHDTGYADFNNTVTYDVIDTTAMTVTSEARLVNTNAFYPAFDVPATTPPGAPFATANLITGTTTAPDGSGLVYAGVATSGTSSAPGAYLKAGEGYYDAGPNGTTCFGCTAWGDYFGGAVDPVNGGLWASGEYARAPNAGQASWASWAGYYPWVTTQTFADVDSSSVYFNFINVLNLWSVTTGCSTTPAKFCPGDPVTRGQMAVFIIRSMYGSAFSYTQTPYFSDVSATDPTFPFIQKLRDLGIATGCGVARYCPGDPVTRWTAAVLLVRGKMASLFGDNFTFPITPYFTDVPASDGGFPFVQKMYELGITSGCTATTYCPNRVLTRQEAAVFLARAFLN
jgi:hypothetical protein